MLLQQILKTITDTIGLLIGGACLMRFWIQWRRLPVRGPLGAFVLGLTNWLVLPLRRVIKPSGNSDWASLVGAYLVSLVLSFILLTVTQSLLTQAPVLAPLEMVAAMSALVVLRWVIYVLAMVVFFSAILSWLNPFSPVLPILDALAAPLLNPIRRVVPLAGRVDLSPIVLVLVLFISLEIINDFSARWFSALV